MTRGFSLLKEFLLFVTMSIVLADPALAAPATAPGPIIRTEISPRLAVVGQPVTLKIDVLVPSWFTAPIDYPSAISVAGVTAQLSNSAAVNLNEHIDNQSYAGMSKLYTVVARQAGEFKIPPLPVKISYSVDGASRAMTLQTTTQTFRAALPIGAEDLGYFFATPNYSLKQTTDRPLNHLKVGDAIVRRITQRAEGVAAMNLPGLTFAELDGVSVYPAEAQLDDSGGERGKVRVGERIDAVTYILRKPGQMELPGLKVGSFDTTNGKMRWASIPAMRFEVAPDPRGVAAVKLTPLTAESVSPAPTGDIKLRAKLLRAWRDPATLPMLGVLSGLVLITFWLKRKGVRPLSKWHKWRQHRRNAEAAHFKRCIANLRDADATSALSATMQWLNHINPDGRGASLTQFAAEYGDTKFRQCVDHLQDLLYARNQSGRTWDALSFKHCLIAARQRWIGSQRSCAQQRNHLPRLNPIYDPAT